MTTNMPHCINKNYLLWLFLSLLLSACLGGGSGNTSTTVQVQGTSLTLLPANSNASGSKVLTALLKDSNNVPLAAQTISFRFTTTNAETLSPQTAVTGTDGTATVTVTDVGSDGGTVTVQASYQALIATAQITFLGDTANQKLQITPAATVLQTGESSLIDVRLLDDQGIPQVGQTINFSVTGQATLEPRTGLTDNDGRVRVTVTDNTAENVQVSITDGTLQSNLSLYFGANLSLLPAKSTGSADGTTAVLLTAQLLDAKGSAIVGETVQFFSLAGNAELEYFKAVTGDNGQVTLNVRNRNVETSTIGAQVGTLPQQQATIDFQSPAPVTETPVNSVIVVAEKTLLNVGGNTQVSIGLSSTVIPSTTKTSVDSTGKITITETTDAVAELLPFTAFNVSVSGGAKLLNVPAKTDANGQALFSLTDSQAENVTLTVSSGGKTQTKLFYFGAKLDLLPQQQNATKIATNLFALLKDANNALIVGETVYFGFDNENEAILEPAEAVTGKGNTASAQNPKATTNDANAIQLTVTDVSGNGGLVIVKATAGELTDTAQLNFSSSISSISGDTTLQASVDRQVLRVGQTATLQARILSNNFPVSNFPVSFFQNNQLISTISTDSNGIATASVSVTGAANVPVEVRAGNAAQNFMLYFGAQLSLTPSDTSGVADDETAVLLNVALQDANGVGVVGQAVNFRLNSGSAMLDAFQVITDEQGRGAVKVTGRQVGNAVLLANSGGVSSNTATIRFASPGIPAKISLQSATLPGALSLNGKDTITATVVDELGNPVAGTQVNFSTSGVGSIEPSALTDANGTAQVIFNALTAAGISTITATAIGANNAPVSANISLTVQPGGAGVIELVSVTPAVIGIRGSGVAQSSTLTFAVKDALGNNVNDTTVTFSLGDSVLGGGESISATSANTVNGLVSVTLQSGNVADIVDVVARVDNANISTLGRVSIVGGVPDARHFSLAAQYLNIAGGATLGLQDRITAFIGDRFGNVVPNGTPINFISEGGTIGTSTNSGAFTSTTEFGQATAILQSAAPTTPHLAGIDNDGDANNNLPNPGLNRIVAYTTGSESFTDSNGNGQWDAGEAFEDLSEPYIDANDSNAFEAGELYIDVNNNRMFDKPDGHFQSNTTIWTSMNVLFSDLIQTSRIQLTSQTADCSLLTLSDIQDSYANPLVSGTKITVTASAGTLSGSDTIEIPDQIAKIGTIHLGLKLEKTENVIFTIDITSPDANTAPGSNGKVSVTRSLNCTVP